MTQICLTSETSLLNLRLMWGLLAEAKLSYNTYNMSWKFNRNKRLKIYHNTTFLEHYKVQMISYSLKYL